MSWKADELYILWSFSLVVKSGWNLGEDLRILVDKAYPMLEDDARKQLALQRYLSQLHNDQIKGNLKQLKQLLKQCWSWSHIWYSTVHLVQLPQYRQILWIRGAVSQWR